MRRRNALLYGTAILSCGVSAAGAQADPVTIQLFFTAFSPTPNPILTTNATLNGSSLTFSGTSTIPHTNGADGILFLPDNNPAIGGAGRRDRGAHFRDYQHGHERRHRYCAQ